MFALAGVRSKDVQYKQRKRIGTLKMFCFHPFAITEFAINGVYCNTGSLSLVNKDKQTKAQQLANLLHGCK